MTGIDAATYAVREYPAESRLPWDNIDTGITKAYLLKEYQSALSGQLSPQTAENNVMPADSNARPQDAGR